MDEETNRRLELLEKKILGNGGKSLDVQLTEIAQSMLRQEEFRRNMRKAVWIIAGLILTGTVFDLAIRWLLTPYLGGG